MQEFDKYIKDNLYNHESPVPAGLWERIVPEKDKKKPAPLPFWMLTYKRVTHPATHRDSEKKITVLQKVICI